MNLVFEGEVNGVKYTDMDAYNNAVKEALKSGKLQAVSRLVPKEESGEKKEQSVESQDEGCKHVLPYVTVVYDEIGEVEQVGLDYMDVFSEYIKENDADDFELKNYSNKAQNIADYAKTIENDPDEMEAYLDDLDKVMSRIEETDEKIDDKIEVLEEKLKNLKARKKLNQTVYNLYMEAFDTVLENFHKAKGNPLKDFLKDAWERLEKSIESRFI